MTAPDLLLPTVYPDDWRRLLVADQIAAGKVPRWLAWAGPWLVRAPLTIRRDGVWSAPRPNALTALLRSSATGIARDIREARSARAFWYDCSDATDTARHEVRWTAARGGWQAPPAVAPILYPQAGGWHEALVAIVQDGDGEPIRLAYYEPQTGEPVTLTDHQKRRIQGVVL